MLTESRCTGCGCTDSQACADGCYWIAVDRKAGTGLCSSCRPMPKPPRRKPPTPVKMWAVVVIHPRADWIHWNTIERTRRGAWDSFLALWNFEGQQQRRADLKAGRYRLARVIVQEVGRG